MGACRKPGPGALGTTAARNFRGERDHDLHRQHRGRRTQYQRILYESQAVPGCNLHGTHSEEGRTPILANAESGLQQRSRADVDEILREPGARFALAGLSRSESILVASDVAMGDGGLASERS